jgi:hypothetical protein
MRGAPQTAKEILRRAVAFHHQIEDWTANGHDTVPILALPGLSDGTPGSCVSCGAAETLGRVRCPMCIAAAHLALDMPVPHLGNDDMDSAA